MEFSKLLHAAERYFGVIPGRAEGASPESITLVFPKVPLERVQPKCEPGFRSNALQNYNGALSGRRTGSHFA